MRVDEIQNVLVEPREVLYVVGRRYTASPVVTVMLDELIQSSAHATGTHGEGNDGFRRTS